MTNLLKLLLVLYCCFCQASPTQIGDVAIYYGTKTPPALRLYRQVIVQDGYDPHFNPREFNTTYRQAFAYTSIGEVTEKELNDKAFDKRWILNKNKIWNTYVIDETNPAWQQFFLNNIITPLWNKGYRAFYLDTVDSYRIAVTDKAQIQKQQAGLISMIQAIKKKYPEAQLILNRGFELLPGVHQVISGITVESVFKGWDNNKKQYHNVTDAQRYWVLRAIDEAKKLGVPVTIIDYLPRDHAADAKTLSNKIKKIGCHAWITNHSLTHFYLPSDFITIPRKILIFYRGQLNNPDERIGSPAIKILSTPLNYLGYNVEIRNINKPLPQIISKTDYAGIIMSIDGTLLGREDELFDFYQRQLRNKIPLVILNDFGFMMNNKQLEPFGLSIPALTHKPHALKVVYQSPMIGYEMQPVLKTYNLISIQLKQGKSLFKVQDEVGLTTDLAGITPWGGYYMGLSFLPSLILGEYRWAINPFKFFQQALQLPILPIPDTTTENGRRLMFTQIDGDGFANKGEWNGSHYVSDMMRKEVLERYRLPSTVSIVQSEMSANGIHPTLSKELEAIAKKIFALPYVEMASHTFSHPFNWHDAAAYKGKSPNPYTLPVANYQFNLKTEIEGSIDYINHQLAPPNKQCTMFLWSGEGDVPEEALKLVNDMGLRNINPGTIMTEYDKSLTRISALGMNEGDYFQVFAPIGNDQEVLGQANNRFFYSLINLINAFKLTEEPLRLKPIDIYLHFFTMAQPGGIKALHAVYDWVLKQPIMAIYGSEYVDKVIDFNHLILSKRDNGWLIATNDHLREIRIPKNMGYPDLINSQHIIGFMAHHDDYYVHLAPGGDALLKLTHIPPTTPYLVSANASVAYFSKNNERILLRFKGHQPTQFQLAHVEHCQITSNNKQLKPDNQQNYTLPDERGEVLIQCH